MVAKETVYAGCRFRSRLEARWAVFFDALGIEWQYEPERIEFNPRLTLKDEASSYLPDFWLPSSGLWVEVKGEWTESQCFWFLNAAAFLSDGSCDGTDSGHDVLVAGPFVGHRYNFPIRLHMHKGDLWANPWVVDQPGSGCAIRSPSFEFQAGADNGDRFTVAARLLRGHDGGARGTWATDALDRARQARFEHGESGILS